MGDWFENETFWRVMYHFLFPEERFSAAPEEIEKIISLVGIKGGRALDLCCGPGRHSTALAKEGFKVTAVDLSPFLLGKAKERGESEKAGVEWVRDDMRKFSRPGEFDLIFNLFTSFGYFEDETDNAAVLSLMYRNLKQGGCIIMDTIAKEILARVYHPTRSTELPDGSIVVQRVKISDDWTRCRNQWLLIKDGKADSYSWSHMLYSGKELKTLLFGAGFNEVKLYGNLDGDPYDPEASRLIAVACK